MALCVFCDIVNGLRPAYVVLETSQCIAILDHHPLFPGHVLVIPRQHHVTIGDLPLGLVEPLFSVVRRLASAVPRAMSAQGSFVAMNNVVSQSVPHVHVHVVPRTKGDGLRGFFWPRRSYDGDHHMVEVRDRIASEVALLTEDA